LEIVGTCEGHDFVFLKSDNISYWFPIGPSENVLKKLGMHSMTTIVELNKSVESVFESLEELIFIEDVHHGVELVTKYFPGLSLSLSLPDPRGSGRFKVAAFLTDPVKITDFSKFWDMIIKSLDKTTQPSRIEMVKEAKIIQRDVNYCIQVQSI